MLTAPMVNSAHVMVAQVTVTALHMLKRNVQALLHERKEDQVSLAQWCGHSKAWINKFLNDDTAEIQLKDLDRIGDFFGVSAYQLFQPGIARVTERRKGERRANPERRIGVDGRLAARLQSEANKLPRLARRADYDLNALPAELKALIEKADRAFTAYEAKIARGQAPSPRGRVAGASPADRGHRGPHPKTPA